jgi:hypothetical protein
MAKTKTLFPLVLGTLLAGCAGLPADKRIPITQERLAQARLVEKEFGIWSLRNCHLHAKRADIEIFTDGRMTANSIFFRLRSHYPLTEAPRIAIWGVGGFNIDLDGRDDTWSFKFPFGPADVARMLSDDVFIVIEYQPTDNPRRLNAVFPAVALPDALKYVSANCLDTSDA